MSDSLHALLADVRAFAAERHWQRYHSPKNLAMALAVEAAELLEVFQWMTQAQSRHVRAEAVRDEVADIAIYVLTLCGVLGIDLAQAIQEKMAKNAVGYPVTKAPPAGSWRRSKRG